jgi:hypothetical protein
MACGAAWSAADAQQSNNGHHYGWRNRDRQQNYNQCGYKQNGRHHGQRREDNDNDNDDNDRDNRDGQYGNNGQYGQYGNNGQYGQYGNCAGQYGYGQNRGNAVVRGTIVGVNGNQVTLQTNNGGYNNGGYGQYGQTITIDDQPALDNRASGRVTTGRYVTAYGYWQNGVFYATQMN